MSDQHPPVSPVLVLAVSITAVSAAALLFRLADGVHPVVAGMWRTAAVGLLLAPSLSRDRQGLGPRSLGLAALAGLFLALHFWAWFESLNRTTVLRSTLLVCLTPIWTGLGEWWLGGERPGRRFWAAIALALVGVGIMATAGGVGEEQGRLAGDALAVVGGLLAAAYLLVGRTVRQQVSIGPYGAVVSGVCALWLLPVSWALDAPLTGFSTAAWLALAGLAFGPQLLGHIGFNYAVRYLPAYIVTAGVLLEPVGAAALGALFLGELPTAGEVGGAVVVLVGVGAATWPQRRRAPSTSSATPPAPPGGPEPS